MSEDLVTNKLSFLLGIALMFTHLVLSLQVFHLVLEASFLMHNVCVLFKDELRMDWVPRVLSVHDSLLSRFSTSTKARLVLFRGLRTWASR